MCAPGRSAWRLSRTVEPRAGIDKRGEIKKGRASLIGGIAVGIAVLALWGAIFRNFGMTSAATSVMGLLVAGAVAAWIRVADL